MKQLSLFKEQKTKSDFGGSLLVGGRRKSQRPLAFKKAMHFVLKADNSILLLRHEKILEKTICTLSAKFGVRVYRLATHADHVHLALKIPDRIIYRRWIRALTSLLVRRIPGLKWKFRPFSKVVSWGRQFKRLIQYVQFNEAEGNLIEGAHQRLDLWRKAVNSILKTYSVY